jgi:vitamin B12 transporter
MNKKVLNLSAALLACAGIRAQEVQNDTIGIQKLDEVVVSDSRFALKRENSGKTVIKITREELERNQGRTVAEVINARSGIEISGSRGRQGTVFGVFARGGRGRQVLVVVDGVRASDPSSFSQEYDLRLLSLANIESIEIVKGAASTLYGTNAATAVINVTTKKASQAKVSGNFQSNLGTNQTVKDQNYNVANFSNAALVSGTLNKLTYNVGFSNHYSSGLSALNTPTDEEDPTSHYSTNIKVGYQISDKFDLTIYGNHTKLSTEFDESFGLIDAPYEFISEQKRAGLSSIYNYGSGSIYLNTSFSDYESDSKSSFPTIFKGENLVADLYNKYIINGKWHTILGVNYIKDKDVFSNNAEFTIVDPYANLVYISSYGLNLNVGGRLNNHSEYGNHLVYNINPSYSISTNSGYVKLLGSYATSYITPNLTQLFGDFGANPDLNPEENRTLEGGLEYTVNDKLRVSALYFDRKEENTIGFDQNFVSINIADIIKVKGIETELFWEPSKNLDLNINYTFTERNGDNAIRIPKHKINTGLTYAFSNKTNASINYAYTGARVDTDFSTFTDVSLESFSLINFYLEHELLSNKLKLFLNASNLLNEEFVEVIGFTTRGRNINMGFTLNL